MRACRADNESVRKTAFLGFSSQEKIVLFVYSEDQCCSNNEKIILRFFTMRNSVVITKKKITVFLYSEELCCSDKEKNCSVFVYSEEPCCSNNRKDHFVFCIARSNTVVQRKDRYVFRFCTVQCCDCHVQTSSQWLAIFVGCSLALRPSRWPSGKASASTVEEPGFESRLRRDFFGVESYQ